MSEQAVDRLDEIPEAQIDAVCGLIRAAMQCRTAHVFVNYSPHVEKVHVYAHPLTTTYEAGEDQVYLMNEDCRIGTSAHYFDENPLIGLGCLAQQVRRC